MQLEICANSYQSAVNAEKAGADRIELCSELVVGGITPSYGSLKLVLSEISIPVFVLIRPRGGNFVYSDAEFEIMKNDIRLCKELGCAGIVSGILNPDNSIDTVRTKDLVELSKPMEFTFHRGFDLVKDPEKSLRELIEIGVGRILTSGQESSAEKGLDFLLKLKRESNGRIGILPGGGITEENAQLFKNAGFDEIHSPAIAVYHEDEPFKIRLNSEKFFDETKLLGSDYGKIKILKELTK